MTGSGRGILAAILVTSLALKLFLLVPAHYTLPKFDSLSYVSVASRLVYTGEIKTLRAPGYPLFLAGVFEAGQRFGVEVPLRAELMARRPEVGFDALDLARLAQVLLSTLSVGLLFWLTLRFFDQRTALAAAAIFAFYPQLVGFSHLLWSETLFLFLLLAALCAAVAVSRRPTLIRAIACGLLVGLCALTRQIGLVVSVLLALWVWADIATAGAGIGLAWSTVRAMLANRSGFFAALAIVVATMIPIVPWALHNLDEHGQVVLISATGGAGLLFGATDDPVRVLREADGRNLAFRNLERDRIAGEVAREIIARDPGAWLWRCLTHNLPALFQPVFDGPIKHLLWIDWGYREQPAWLVRALVVLLCGSYAALLVAATCGVWATSERRYTVLFLLLLAGWLASHLFILGVTRHRLPLEMLAAVPAGFAVTRSPRELATGLSAARLVGVAITLLALGGLLVLSDLGKIRMFWTAAAAKFGG